jgi:anti-sigma factor RsiW
MTLTPEILLAYADGLLDEANSAQVAAALEGDAQARETVRLIRLSGAALAKARATLSAAQAVPGDDAVATSVRGRATAPWQMAAAIALLAVGIGAGLMLSPTVFGLRQDSMDAASWVMSVAEYQALYGRMTVEAARTSDEERAALEAQMTRELRREARVPVPDLEGLGLEFRSGQILEYDGWPLVQLEYLPRDGGRPIALCFKRFGEGRSPRRFYTVDGMAVMQWARDGMEFLIVGDATEDAMSKAADATNRQVFEAL